MTKKRKTKEIVIARVVVSPEELTDFYLDLVTLGTARYKLLLKPIKPSNKK